MSSAAPHRTAWFHCFAGISGDMALGSLLDAGADLAEVRLLLDRLPLTGWALDARPVLRGGLAATQALVSVTNDGAARQLGDMLSLLEAASLPERVRARSEAVFRRLAGAEARVHRKTPDTVHFHELSGHDTIIDVVGTAAALEVLDIDTVSSGPVTTGTGTMETAHGVLPNPSPAVLELLAGAPLSGSGTGAELVTPTGAALLAALCSSFGPLPAMTVLATGYGAGSREQEGVPNCAQVVIGLGANGAAGPGRDPARQPDARWPGDDGTAAVGALHGSDRALRGQPLVLLETNLDDATGEQLADALAGTLAAGAFDAWITPVVMKKGRPGHLLSALCDVALSSQVRHVLVAETGVLGVRSTALERYTEPRGFAEVLVDGLPVRVKVSPGRVKAEHDDAASAARQLGIAVREVARRAEAAWGAGKAVPPGAREVTQPRR